MISAIRVGINMIGGKSWLGGANYILLLVKAVKTLTLEERPMLFLIVTDHSLQALELYAPMLSEFTGIVFVGANREIACKVLPPRTIYFHSEDELFDFIDFIFPVTSSVMPSRCSASWIEDFQHCYLPQFFSPQDVAGRDERFKKVAKQAKLIVFSSQTVLNDFYKFYPGTHAITKILSFYSKPEVSWYRDDYEFIQKKYALPDRFIICCNQFWVHKNHVRLVQAIDLVRKSGQEVTLVCTGGTDDYRARGYFPHFLEYINSLGLKNIVHVLGIIPREDQLQLIRRSLFVVQPSLFEGWSTVVEDCRVLGKTIILSDIDVHLEQKPQHAIYFSKENTADLAEKICDALKVNIPGPDFSREEIARANADVLVEGYARQFCDIVKTAVFDIGKRSFVETMYSSAPIVSHERVEIVTSLTTNNIDVQKKAITSWVELGFAVTSLNAIEDIDIMKAHFPEVNLVPVARDARQKYGQPFVYFDDMREYFRHREGKICGIVTSDVHLIFHQDLQSFLVQQAQGGMVFGSRVDVENLVTRQGTVDHTGFDYFFFDRQLLEVFPPEVFCTGQPWFDYWLPIVPLSKGLPVKRLLTPVAYHLKHSVQWNQDARTNLGMVMAKYIPTPEPVNEKNIIQFLQFVCRIIREKAQEIQLS